MRYAGFWKRFFAYGYDSLIVAIIAMVLKSYLPGHDPVLSDMALQLQAGNAQALQQVMQWIDDATLDAMLISAVYNILFVLSAWQATPGKRYCGIKVVRADGGKLTLVQSIIRHAATGLSVILCGAGFLMIAFTREKTALHDVIAKTRVVYREPA